MITEQQLKSIMPKVKEETLWSIFLSTAMTERGIDTLPRIQIFISQLAVESGELNRLEENLNYSSSRLMKVWPSRFPTMEDALPYAYRSEALANKVYSNRMGNGDEESGEGWLYRGRGLIQLTGKQNYKMISNILNMPAIVDDPDLLLNKEIAARSAAAYWEMKGLNSIADYDTMSAFNLITRKINGGLVGLSERVEYWRRAKVYIV